MPDDSSPPKKPRVTLDSGVYVPIEEYEEERRLKIALRDQFDELWAEKRELRAALKNIRDAAADLMDNEEKGWISASWVADRCGWALGAPEPSETVASPATCPECEGRGVKGGHGDLRDCPACKGTGEPSPAGTNIKALYKQRREAELACELSREENRRLVEQMEAAQDALRAICEPYGEGRRYIDIVQIARDALNPASRPLCPDCQGRGATDTETGIPCTRPSPSCEECFTCGGTGSQAWTVEQ